MTVPVVMRVVVLMLVVGEVLVSEVRRIEVRVLLRVIAENAAVSCA